MSSDQPPTDDNFEYFEAEGAPLSADDLRALELVRHAENRVGEYYDDLAYYRKLRFPRLFEQQVQDQGILHQTGPGTLPEYDPINPIKIQVIDENGDRKTIGAWNLIATEFNGKPTWLYVDANNGKTYITQREHDNDNTLPMPFAPEDLALHDLGEVTHFVAELKRQGQNLVLIAASVGEG